MKDKKPTEKYTEFYKAIQPMELPLAQIIAQRLRVNLKKMSGITPAKYRREYDDRGKQEWTDDIRKMIYALEDLYLSCYLDEGKNLSSEIGEVENKSSICETNLEKIKKIDEGMKLLQENYRSWISIDLDWFNLFSKKRLDSDDRSISFQNKELEHLTNGLHKGELLVIGARPAMGKTSFGIYIANALSIKQPISGVFISIEQHIEQLVNSFSRYDRNSLMYDNVSETGYPKLTKVQNYPLFLVDIPGLGIEELRERLHHLVNHQHIKYAIIDYVQLLNGRKDVEYANRDEELKEVLLQLKAIAVELQITIIATSQINKRIDSSSRVPDSSWFPHQIFCPADTILALHRPEYYTPNEEVNKLKIILIQHPYQMKGEITLGFKEGITDDISDTNDINTEIGYYHSPTEAFIHFLRTQTQPIDHSFVEEGQKEKKERLIKVLYEFGVKVLYIKVSYGKYVTRYDIISNRHITYINKLAEDIAFRLNVDRIRIAPPENGQNFIGVEVPNGNSHVISMKELLAGRTFHQLFQSDSDKVMPIMLGTAFTQGAFVCDLVKMPHLLIAGATGQGKTNLLNTIVTSLLFYKNPQMLKFVMIDLKNTEFDMYNRLENHFLAKLPISEKPVITEVNESVVVLRSLCKEMKSRQNLLKDAKCRNIKEYNRKVCSQQELPYIVVVIDEFSDLLISAKEAEKLIIHLAETSHKVGIHLVIATQLTEKFIITEKMKACFSSRIALRVACKIDSKLILNQSGAECLNGNGDMLFLTQNYRIARTQCPFVKTSEIEKLVDFIADQKHCVSPYTLPNVEKRKS